MATVYTMPPRGQRHSAHATYLLGLNLLDEETLTCPYCSHTFVIDGPAGAPALAVRRYLRLRIGRTHPCGDCQRQVAVPHFNTTPVQHGKVW